MKKVNTSPLSIDDLLKLEGLEIECRLKGGNPTYTEKHFEKFKNLISYLKSEMKQAKARYTEAPMGGIPQ